MPPTSRDSAIETARSYLAALVHHDADRARLAKDAHRTNNGKLAVEGADAIRAILRREPVAETSTERWIVDGEQALVFYDLAYDAGAAEAKPGPREKWMPVYVGERFAIRGGEITEIEVVHHGDSQRTPRPERPSPRRSAQTPTPRDGVIAACQAYLDALVSHDASAVPLAEDCWRVENGADTGSSGEAIVKGLESPIMQTVAGVEDVRWYVDGDDAATLFTLRVQAGERRATCRIAERFRVRDGELIEIESVVSEPEWAD
jgi:limonene-1,2-epoxide hydrolase